MNLLTCQLRLAHGNEVRMSSRMLTGVAARQRVHMCGCVLPAAWQQAITSNNTLPMII
jgi:hypothetical protein